MSEPATCRRQVAGESNGAEDWNRTSDTSIFSAVLYQLSYLGLGYGHISNRPESSQTEAECEGHNT